MKSCLWSLQIKVHEYLQGETGKLLWFCTCSASLLRLQDVKACDCQLYWRGLNKVRSNSVQTWPLPDVEPFWTSSFAGLWTRNCLLNTASLILSTALCPCWYATRYMVGSVLTWKLLMGFLYLSDLTCGGYKKFTFVLECLRPGITCYVILRSRWPNPGDTTTEAQSINKNVCLCTFISASNSRKNFKNQKVELRKRGGSNFFQDQRGDPSVRQTDIRCKIQVIVEKLI